jgi:hypothetical protein
MSTQPEPSVAAARSSRSRSRSRSRSEAETVIEGDSDVDPPPVDVAPEGPTPSIGDLRSLMLQTPQIAPGHREHRFVQALDERETRQLMRNQSLRHWWHMRGRRHNSGGVDMKVLKAWMGLGFPASATVPAFGAGSRRYLASPPLASPEHNVIVDPGKEMALWDKWGREAWLIIVASEEDWIVDNGYTFEVSQAQFAFDLSLFAVPSSPYVNVFP